MSAEKADVWAQTKRLTKLLDDASAKLAEREKQLDKARHQASLHEDELRKVGFLSPHPTVML